MRRGLTVSPGRSEFAGAADASRARRAAHPRLPPARNHLVVSHKTRRVNLRVTARDFDLAHARVQANQHPGAPLVYDGYHLLDLLHRKCVTAERRTNLIIIASAAIDLAQLSYWEAHVRVNMHEAKSQLSRLAELAWQGEEIVICKAGKPWLNLLPYRERMRERVPGGLEGQIRMAPDFDDEDEELISEIEGSKIYPDET